MLALTVTAQTKDCITRKSFAFKSGDWLSVTGKYGEIKISSTGEDSIIICSTVTIKQNNPELQKKSLSLIMTGIDKIADTVYVSTSFDEKFFSAPYNASRTGFTVNYSIIVPQGINLRIDNSFGDVSLDNCEGYTGIKVSHGNLNTGKLGRGNIKPVNSVYADYGTVNIEEANWITVNTIHCPSVSMGIVKAAVIASRFSRISSGIANSLVCDSRSDIIEIQSVNNLAIQSSYSAINISRLNGQLAAESNFGSINISKLSKDFSLIDLISSRTPVSIKTEPGTSFSADIRVSAAIADIPFEYHPSLINQPDNGTTKISGTWGTGKSGRSVVRINSHGGNLEIK